MVELVRVADHLWRRADAIPGWFSREEADLVYTLCESPWCEIGCHRGRSTVILAAKGPGTVVDTFQGTATRPAEPGWHLREFMENTRGFAIRIVVGRFERKAGNVGSIRFLHLDADHSYEATKLAFDLYTPKLVRGGHVALHDAWGEEGSKTETAWPGSMRFAKELMESPGWEHVGDARRLAAFKKL